ncbi:MAG: response regulator [Bacteroidota bacterium]|jgi:response regulator of citrate/malate metabolism
MQENTITILLVDDDPGYGSIVKHRLGPFQNKRFEVIWESQSENALKLLRENKAINLVLMDYYLQEKTGLDVTKQIYEEKIDVPIIFLTSNKDFRAAVEAMKYGVEDYLLKEDIIDTVLPRTILNVLDRVDLKRKIAEVEKRKLLSQKKTEAIQEVVVTICHELNNPLAAIKITTSILSRQQLSNEETRLLEKLNLNVTSLEQQIKKLRDLNIDQTV